MVSVVVTAPFKGLGPDKNGQRQTNGDRDGQRRANTDKLNLPVSVRAGVRVPD